MTTLRRRWRVRPNREDRVASKDEARESLEEQHKEAPHKLRLREKKLQCSVGRNRDLALKVKQTQEMVRVAEKRALESEALHIAVAKQLQRAEEEVAVARRLRVAAASEGPVRVEGSTQTEAAPAVDPQMVQDEVKICYDAVWGTFHDDGYERRLVYTFLPGEFPGNCHLSFCRDPESKLMFSTDQNEKVAGWKRHGWVVDRHIENSPQAVMKRIVGYVGDVPERATATCKQTPGC